MPELEIRESLGRIEGKLDIIIPLIGKHDKRISKVENKQSWFSGGLAFLGILWFGFITMMDGK